MVDDTNAEFERRRELGVHFKAEKPIAIEAGVNKGGYTIYFTDTDGITLELIQPPPYYDQSAIASYQKALAFPLNQTFR